MLGTPCGESRVCLNNPGSFKCKCLEGKWDKEKKQCITGICNEEINCHKEAKCSEVDNKPVCSCNDGYSGNGFFCEKSKHKIFDMLRIFFAHIQCQGMSSNLFPTCRRQWLQKRQLPRRQQNLYANLSRSHVCL